MVFRYLEDNLDENKIESYLKVFGDLQEPTRTCLGHTLDMASYLNSLGLSGGYSVFGGYAVLSHLMQEYGVEVAKSWRGSSDIDMAGTLQTLNAIRSGYIVDSDAPSPNISDKRTLKLHANQEKECKIDFSEGDFFNKYGVPVTNYHFDIPLKVIEPKALIKGKLETPLEQSQHAGDVLGLISILERRKFSPSELSLFFIGEPRELLFKRLTYAEKEFNRDRLGFFPTVDYLSELKKDLAKASIKISPQNF